MTYLTLVHLEHQSDVIGCIWVMVIGLSAAFQYSRQGRDPSSIHCSVCCWESLPYTFNMLLPGYITPH